MSNIPLIPFSKEPIPSHKMQVLDANTRSLDEFMNSDEKFTQDRNGDNYKTRKELIREVEEALKNIGYVIQGGSFEVGATLTQQNAALLYQADGQYYQWTGDLPKIIPANSTPETTGGFGNGAWVLASDKALRQELKGGGGASFVGYGESTVHSQLELTPVLTLKKGVVAHRGDNRAYPENTLASILAAEMVGACEFDVVLTKDNHWVVIHDSSVDRTTDGSGAVRSFTLEEIQKLDVGQH